MSVERSKQTKLRFLGAATPHHQVGFPDPCGEDQERRALGGRLSIQTDVFRPSTFAHDFE
jgi:hypothetical protein